MDDGHFVGSFGGGGGNELVLRFAAGEFPLGVEADALVGVGEAFYEIRSRNLGGAGSEHFRDFLADGGASDGGVVELPDGSFFVERVASTPVGGVEGAIGAEVDADVHGAFDDGVVIGHLEGGSLLFYFEGTDGAFGELRDEEGILVFFVEGGAGVEGEAGGAVRVIQVRGGDVGRLELTGSFPDVFCHPGVVCRGTILVVVPPAGIRSFGNVEKSLAFAFAVGVVIDGKEVPILIEGDFLGVAEASRKNFETTSVRVAAEDGAFVRGEEIFPFLGGDVDPLVADGPIDAPVGAEDESVHVVTGVGDVDAESVCQDLTFVGLAVAGGVTQFPYIRSDGGIDVTAPCEGAGGDAGDLCVEVLREDAGGIVFPVAVFIGDADDFLGDGGEILAVDLAVLVVVLEGGFGKFVFSVELLPEEGELVLDGGMRDVFRDPAVVVELADIEIGGFAAGGFGDVDGAIHVHGNGDGVLKERLFSDEGAFEAVGGGEGLGKG